MANNNTPTPKEWWKELDDYECRSMYCTHEISKKHYILTNDEISTLLSQQKQELVEEIKKGQRGLYHKIVDNHCDECRILTHIINLLENK